MVLLLSTCLLLSTLWWTSNSLVIGRNDTSTTELSSVLHSTLGNHFELTTRVNVTIIHREELGCTLLVDPSRLQGHFLVYAEYLFEEEDTIFKSCLNYFYDASSNGCFFAHISQQAGAAGVLLMRNDNEGEYSGYRITGFSSITIPVLVTTKANIELIVNEENNITYFDIDPISDHDKNFLKRLKDVFHGLRIINCILYPILTVLTAYFAYTDILLYRAMNEQQRSLHPTLTKAAPFISALFVSIWMIADPYSFKLTKHFPAVFFERFYFGFLFVTASLLLKTWILAVGNKLKSQQVLRVSNINAIVLIDILFSALWVFVGRPVRMLAVVFGALTALGCGAGYIYYGKDIVIILSKGGTHASYRHLSIKVVIFTVVFVVFIYTVVIVYFANAMGGVLSELMLQFLTALAFITIYSVLFFRKATTPDSPSGSKGSKGSKDSANKDTSQGASKSSSSHGIEAKEEMQRSKSGKEVVVVQV